MRSDLLSPPAALALARRLLAEAGFTETARNARGDSLYLRRGAEPGTLRLSNHARTPIQRRRHPEVATSLVLHDPKSPKQVAAMVASAVRMLEAGSRRASGATAGAAPSEREPGP